MDSRAVLARFDAERNALALMNHPNIAKVLDAGTTEQGRPYFVMELIQGKPITEYCDQKKLTVGQRLELFTQVCNAIQHAHQKGVIHRDIKPTNILVTEIDGKPVPKVIDFGVAKALGAKLTDRTVYTSFQSLVGTPLYMSPEQTLLTASTWTPAATSIRWASCCMNCSPAPRRSAQTNSSRRPRTKSYGASAKQNRPVPATASARSAKLRSESPSVAAPSQSSSVAWCREMGA